MCTICPSPKPSAMSEILCGESWLLTVAVAAVPAAAAIVVVVEEAAGTVLVVVVAVIEVGVASAAVHGEKW